MDLAGHVGFYMLIGGFGCNCQPNANNVVINSVFILGLALFILGFAVEVIADNQKTAFRSIPENKDCIYK